MFNAPPSIDRKQYQSKGQKMAIFFGIFLVFIPTLISVIVVASMLSSVFRRETSGSDLTFWLIYVIVGGAGTVGIIKRIPQFRRPVDFSPRFGAIPSGVYGQPFDVRLQRKTFGSAFEGEGVVQFFPDHLIVDGHRDTHGYVQLAIFLLVTIIPLLTVGGMLGVIPALLLAKYVGRKKQIQPIYYQQIRSIKQNGNTVTVDCPSLSPAKSVFYVASVDGPRLHGELHPRFAGVAASSS